MNIQISKNVSSHIFCCCFDLNFGFGFLAVEEHRDVQHQIGKILYS